jgi:ABC-type glycerol-3-phosphate transport system permease component
MAGAMLRCIPVVILYFLFVDKYVQGMSGALEG